MRRFAMILTIAALLLPLTTVAAPLKDDVDTLIPLGEGPLPVTQAVAGERVVVALIRQGNIVGEQMLRFLATFNPPPPDGKLVIVLSGGDEAVLRELSGAHPALAVRWYRDPGNALARRAGISSIPALIGMENGKLSWIRSGISDRKLLEKTVRGWVGR